MFLTLNNFRSILLVAPSSCMTFTSLHNTQWRRELRIAPLPTRARAQTGGEGGLPHCKQVLITLRKGADYGVNRTCSHRNQHLFVLSPARRLNALRRVILPFRVFSCRLPSVTCCAQRSVSPRPWRSSCAEPAASCPPLSARNRPRRCRTASRQRALRPCARAMRCC